MALHMEDKYIGGICIKVRMHRIPGLSITTYNMYSTYHTEA